MVSIYSPATGQIFKGQKKAGNLPDPNMPVEPSPDPTGSKETTHPPVHPNPLGRTMEGEVSTSVDITHENKTIETSTRDTGAEDGPYLTSN